METIIIPDKKKRLSFIVVFAALLGVSVIYSIAVGTINFQIHEFIDVLKGDAAGLISHQIIYNIRLPRILTGALAGMNLAVAGALLQGVLRNPLASPQIIGVNSGAACMAVLVMVVFPGFIDLLPVGAFLGALAASMMVYGLASKQGSGATANIVLAGVAISALLHAFTSALMIINSDELQVTYTWLIGGLTGRGWSHFNMLWPYCLLGLLSAVLLSPKINLFMLGDEIGSSLGLEVKLYRLLIIINASLLAGSAVSVVGTVGFVGLIAPHLARLLLGNDYRYLVVLSAILGSLLLVTADTLARILFQPVELPVGILTAALGAPFFFYLMYRKKNSV